MRRLTVLLALLGAACGRGSGGPQTPVPQSVNAALEQFLSAVKANDLSRMGTLWGTDRGPASQWMKPDELRQRLTIIQKYLDYAGYRIVEGPLAVPSRDDLRTYRVDLQRSGCNQVVQIDVIRTRSGGWLVHDVHLESAGSPATRCQPAGSGTRP
jgi:hypothetical protein